MKKLAEATGISTTGLWITLIVLMSCIGGCTYRVAFLKFVDSYEAGYKYNKSTGEVTVLEETGYYKVTPFVTVVNTVDLRPMQIRIEANNRVLNAMLVRFRKEGLQQFIDLHGRKNYDKETLSDILKSYAYEGMGTSSYSREALQKKYRFLEILGSTSGAGNDSQNQTLPQKDTLK